MVSALDALIIINRLSRGGLPVSPPISKVGSFFDVSGDGNVTALDALQVINALARQSTRKINAIPAKIQWEGRDFEDEFWSELDWVDDINKSV